MSAWSDVLAIAHQSRGLHYTNLPIPSTCLIPGGLTDGKKIFIHAIPRNSPDRFTINFQNGPDESSDICFHFNVRFGENDVVMNTRKSDEWSDEVRGGETSFPFAPSNDSLIEITTTQAGYEIIINGQYYNTFPHRDAFKSVTHVAIAGDVRVPSLHILQDLVPNDNNLTIPWSVRPGSVFYLSGNVPSGTPGFSVNLYCDNCDDSDIMLHVNPRFSGTNQLIRNARFSGDWGEEERDGYFSLAEGQRFTLMISAEKETYRIWTDGKEVAKFPHRNDMTKACVLKIDGDVKIQDIYVDIPPKALPGFEDTIRIGNPKDEIYNSVNPVTLEVKNFKPGDVICLSALLTPDPTRFKLNFQAGPEEDADIILHCNPRWDQGERHVVLNSREGGEWGGEEIWNELNISPLTRFEVIVYCSEEDFKVSLHGKEPRSFHHRLHYGNVKCIVVDGCVEVKRLILC